MKLPDLLFIFVFLGTLIALVRIAWDLHKRKWDIVRRIGARLLLFVAVYLCIVVGVSVATPRQWVGIGEEQRFDDWCVSIVREERIGNHYLVVARVSNRGRGRPQAASNAKLMLVANDGRAFELIVDPTARSLRSRLQAGESFETTCQCDLPEEAQIIGIDVRHGAWPQWFIIGDRDSLMHKRTLVR